MPSLRSRLSLPSALVLARGNAAVAHDQGLKERTVLVEYPSLEKAIAAYDSPAYAEALKALGDGAKRDFRIVEGIESIMARQIRQAGPFWRAAFIRRISQALP